jgi:hypothetical protein
MVNYIPYPKAIKSLVDRFNATPEELAAWVWMTPKNNGLAAYLNANELDPPPRFFYGSLDSSEFDYIPPLMACWFKADDIASFKPIDRYITGAALIERWEIQPNIQAKGFIQAKIEEARLSDFHPLYGGTQASSPEGNFPPLESGLFLLAEIELIEIEEFGCILLNIPEPVTISNTDANKLKKTSDLTIFHTMEGLSFKEIIIRIDPEKYGLRISARNMNVTSSFRSIGLMKKNEFELNAPGETFMAIANGSFSPDTHGTKRALTSLSLLLREAFGTSSTPFLKSKPQFNLRIPKNIEAARRARDRTSSFNDDLAIPRNKSGKDYLRINDSDYDPDNQTYSMDDEY